MDLLPAEETILLLVGDLSLLPGGELSLLLGEDPSLLRGDLSLLRGDDLSLLLGDLSLLWGGNLSLLLGDLSPLTVSRLCEDFSELLIFFGSFSLPTRLLPFLSIFPSPFTFISARSLSIISFKSTFLLSLFDSSKISNRPLPFHLYLL